MSKFEDLAKFHISSGDGETAESAFVFDSDCTEAEAVAFEYEVIAELYGYELSDFVQQKFFTENDKCYDALVFNVDGCERTIYFDITTYFANLK